jgi:hypothetical protein
MSDVDLDLIPLSEEETAALIKRSDHENPLCLVFGAHGASLRWKESKWTLPILAEMRGVPVK